MCVLGILAFSSMGFKFFLATNPITITNATGSPCDGNYTCTDCHNDYAINSGPATFAITSNIPSWGYTPGATYSITATISQTGFSMYQFELSPQKDPGCVAFGVLTAGPTTFIQTGGVFQYISAINANSVNTWTFTWTAPSAGTGIGKFYAAFNAANNDGVENGDYIYNTSYTVQEFITGPLGATAASTNPFCYNLCTGTATVTPTGGTPPYSYLWSNGKTIQAVTGLCAGNYSVLVTDATANTCTASVAIIQPSLLAISLTLVQDTSNILLWYGYDTITGGTSPYTYFWNFGDGNTSIQPYPAHTYSVAGHYSVCVTVSDANGCTATTCDSTYRISSGGTIKDLNIVNPLTVGVESTEAGNDVTVFPNPTNGLINLKTDRIENKEIKIYNVYGDCIYQHTGTVSNFQIDLSSQPTGIYFLKIKTTGKVRVKKIVMRR